MLILEQPIAHIDEDDDYVSVESFGFDSRDLLPGWEPIANMQRAFETRGEEDEALFEALMTQDNAIVEARCVRDIRALLARTLETGAVSREDLIMSLYADPIMGLLDCRTGQEEARVLRSHYPLVLLPKRIVAACIACRYLRVPIPQVFLDAPLTAWTPVPGDEREFVLLTMFRILFVMAVKNAARERADIVVTPWQMEGADTERDPIDPGYDEDLRVALQDRRDVRAIIREVEGALTMYITHFYEAV